MRITVKSLSTGNSGLPVIPEIDAPTPTRVEGQNGIGKTLLVRLLELVSGEQPYASRPDLWGSLREGLRPLSITVEGLQSQKMLTARLDPTAWPDSPEPVDDWLGEMRLGTRKCSVADAAAVFGVVRFAGNEDLRSVIDSELSRQHHEVASDVDVLRGRIRALQARLGPLDDLLAPQHPERLRELRAVQAEAKAAVDGVESRLADARERHTAAERALRIQQLLQPAGKAEAELSEVRRLSDELATARATVDDIDRRLEEVLQELEKRGQVDAEVAQVERALRSRERRLQTLQDEVATAVSQCGLNSEPDGKDLAALQQQQEEAVETLRARRTEVDASARTRVLIGDLLPPVETAVDEGLADQVVAEYNSTGVSVSDLRLGLTKTDSRLRDVPTPAEAASLDAELAAAHARLAQLQELEEKKGLRDRQGELVDEAQSELTRVHKKKEAAGSASAEYKDLVEQRRAIGEQMQTLTGQLVAARTKAGLPRDQSPADLQGELDDLLASLGITGEEVARVVGETIDQEREANEELARVQGALELARRDLSASITAGRHSARELLDSPRFAWARSQVDSSALGSDEKREQVLGDLATRTRNVARELAVTEDLLTQIVDYTERISQQTALPDQAADIAEALWSALETRVRTRLDSPAIRQFLFGGNELAAVDLRAKTIRWSADGRTEERPFEAFSTGEQAFAFTQARILSLPPLPAKKDRLLVLDEFGAFIAADRADALAEFLVSAEVRERASTVLVVLPQQVDYSVQLDFVTGELKQRYQARVRELADRGYFTEPLQLTDLE